MKIRFISIIMAVLLALSSCSGKTETPDNLKDDGIVYGQPDTEGMNVFYVATQLGLIPFCYTVDGKMRMTGDNYYYNIESVVNAETALREKSYTAFNTDGKNLGTVPFTGLDSEKRAPYSAMISSGNWKICPDIRHTEYAVGKDKSGDEYKRFILESFPDRFSSLSDIAVTDIWECDIDGDGTAEAIVRTGNGSTVLALLSQSMGNKILASDFENADFTAQPFIADLYGNGAYSLIILCGQSYKTVTICKQSSADTLATVYMPLNS